MREECGLCEGGLWCMVVARFVIFAQSLPSRTAYHSHSREVGNPVSDAWPQKSRSITKMSPIALVSDALRRAANKDHHKHLAPGDWIVSAIHTPGAGFHFPYLSNNAKICSAVRLTNSGAEVPQRSFRGSLGDRGIWLQSPCTSTRMRQIR